jgi:hypothetical protein
LRPSLTLRKAFTSAAAAGRGGGNGELQIGLVSGWTVCYRQRHCLAAARRPGPEGGALQRVFRKLAIRGVVHFFGSHHVWNSRKGEGGIMKTLIGGAVAAALGLIGLGFWWKEFLMVLGGTIPAVLLLGGGLAIYLGFDEMKDTWKKDEPATSSVGSDELEKYKSEISDLKRELEGLKSEKKSE